MNLIRVEGIVAKSNFFTLNVDEYFVGMPLCFFSLSLLEETFLKYLFVTDMHPLLLVMNLATEMSNEVELSFIHVCDEFSDGSYEKEINII